MRLCSNAGAAERGVERKEGTRMRKKPICAGPCGYLGVKRFLDVLLGGVLLLALSPVLLVCAAAVRLDSKGPVLFRQQRVGRKGKLFWVYKFRTMYVQAPANLATAQMTDSRRYITRVGRVLRRASLDELPQLLNVLAGDMSLVGPRPLIPAEERVHTWRRQYGVYAVRPGITGLAQVKGRDNLSDWQKIRWDRLYVQRVSLAMDFRVLAATVAVVVTHRHYAEGGQTVQAPSVRMQGSPRKKAS